MNTALVNPTNAFLMFATVDQRRNAVELPTHALRELAPVGANPNARLKKFAILVGNALMVRRCKFQNKIDHHVIFQ